MLLGNDAFFDLCSLTGPLTEVIELRPADNAVANNFDPADARAVIGESPLNAYTVADTANGESLADAAALHFDDDAFKILEPFAVSFNEP